MSTLEPPRVKAERPGERALFRGLFDDAAVFPPGLRPLPEAVADHMARRSTSYGDLVGPLLVPASAIEDLLNLEHSDPGFGLEAGLEVAVVGRPGTDLAVVGEALSRLGECPTVRVSGIEIAWSPGWHQIQRWGARTPDTKIWDAPRSIEVPQGAEMQEALSDLQAHRGDGFPVQAKLRTGSTPQRPAPTTTQVATFIRACVDHDLSFKLTGGLHHAVSQTTRAGEDQLGFLNVIAATRWALAHGAEVPEMESLLSERGPVPILDIITRMSGADASVLRAFFTAYGCCTVMDPIGELTALGLISEEPA